MAEGEGEGERASSASGFARTRKFREAARLVNTIQVSKLPLFLSRILEKVHLRNERFFTETEEERLSAMFSLAEDELQTVLEGCSYIFEQAAYQGMKPSALQQQLQDAGGFSEEHAQSFAEMWGSASGAAFVRRLRERSMGGPQVLTDTNWRMHLMMGESALTRVKDTTTIFSFTLANPDATEAASASAAASSGVTGSAADEVVSAEFSHDELYRFFLDLETIQEQLDGLTST